MKNKLPKWGLLLLPLLLLGAIANPAKGQLTCLNDFAQFNNPTCTANDVRISTLQVLNGVVECLEGEVVQITTRAQFIAGASERYDIGVYIALDGGDAKTGLCARDFFFPIDANPANWNVGDANNGGTVFPNLEFADDPDDKCGDIQQNVGTFRNLTPLEVICTDVDNNGKLDLGTCLSWDNNKSDTCTGLADIIPGTPSKCRCEPVNVDVVVKKTAEIELVKSLSPTSDAGTFDLQIDGVTETADAGHNGSTGKVVVTAGTQVAPGATHTVGEITGTSSTVPLAGYNSSISCVKRGTATVVASGTNAGPLNVTVQPDDDILCTVTNTRLTISPTPDAKTALTNTYTWNIKKEVSPALHNLFVAETASSNYTVTATSTGSTASGWAISGNVSVTNPHAANATIQTLGVSVSGLGAATVVCNPVLPVTLSTGQTKTCTYSIAAPDASARTVTASVTTSGAIGAGADGTVQATFNGSTTVTDVNNPVKVTDNFNGGGAQDLGSALAANSPVVFNATTNPALLKRDFTCSSTPADYDADGKLSFSRSNVARIVETNQTADAKVDVNCYAPVVSKTANTTFRRTWTWTIKKTGADTELTLSPGQTYLEAYKVEVSAVKADDQYAANGVITVKNNHPSKAMAVTLADVMGGINATLACGGNLNAPAAGQATCNYSADLPNANGLTNTATATLNAVKFSGTAAVSFNLNAPTSEIDECIDVKDSLKGVLGTVCADKAPASFDYNYLIGPFSSPAQCGLNEVPNTASLKTNDLGKEGSSDWLIKVNVPCEVGCTLTQGYWKTHNETFPGGAPPDDTWLQILPGAESTIFFLSGQTYYQVMWTPSKGNVYYQLASQYIAAVLNGLNGASLAAVQTAIADATTIFSTKTPAEVGGLKGSARNAIVTLAGTLASYNEGAIGPGHCSEEKEGTNFSTAVKLTTSTRVETLAEAYQNIQNGRLVLNSRGEVEGEPDVDAQKLTDAEANTKQGTDSQLDKAGEAFAEVPKEFGVNSYPNPFHGSATVRIALPEPSEVSVIVYDLLGRQVARLSDGSMPAGIHEIAFDARNLPSGTYLYSVKAGENVKSGQMLLMR